MKILRTKTIKEVREDAGKTGMKKSLGAMDLILLGLGGIIGTGIFVLTGLAAAKYAGPAITISFMLGAVACVFTALAFAELASMLPVSGGAYSYAYVTVGEGVAAIVGWTSLMIYTFAAATVASGWSGYVVGMLHSFGISIPEALTKIPSEGGIINLPAVLILALISVFLVRGNSSAAKLNGILVFVKLAAILIFIFAAVPHVNIDNWAVFAPHGFFGIAAGAGFVLMAYTGFDTLATAAEECKNPNRDLPIGIVGSLVGSAILYVIVSGLLTSIVPYTELNNAEPMAYALRAIQVPIGAKLVATGAIAGMTTVILTQIFAQSRVLMVMARDGMMPKYFSKVHKKYGTPHVGIMFSCFIMIGIVGVLPVSTLGQLSSMASLAIFAFVSLAVMIMRYKKPDEKRTFRCPAVYLVASLSVLICGFLFSQLLIENWVPYLSATVVGILVYAGYGYHNSTMNKPRKKGA